MNTIQGIPRRQMQFTSLDDFIGTENAVRIIDAFVEKLDLVKLGISCTLQPIRERPHRQAGHIFYYTKTDADSPANCGNNK